MLRMLRILRSIIKRLKKIFYTTKVRYQAKSVGNELHVNGKSSVSPDTILGNNVNFNGMQIIGGHVTIGNNFHSGEECLIIAQNHNYENGESIPYDTKLVDKDVTIEDNVWVGTRVVILGGVHIGEGAVIQAGSVVSSNIPKYAVAGGNPAKEFKKRNVEHYNKLKAQNKFE